MVPKDDSLVAGCVGLQRKGIVCAMNQNEFTIWSTRTEILQSMRENGNAHEAEMMTTL